MSTYKVKEVQQWDTLVKTKEGNWIPARPVNHKVRSFSEKLKEPWLVLIGKLDTLKWGRSVG